MLPIVSILSFQSIVLLSTIIILYRYNIGHCYFIVVCFKKKKKKKTKILFTTYYYFDLDYDFISFRAKLN